MRKPILLAIGICCSCLTFAQEAPVVVTGELMKIVPSLKELHPDPAYNPRVTRDLTGLLIKKTYKETIRDFGTRATGDPVVQKEFLRTPKKLSPSSDQPNAGSTIGLNYDGMGFTNVSPADPTMTAGPNHIIQMINGSQGSYFRIWNKSGGNVVNQTYMYQLFATPGYSGAGDPIVLYDQFADRYVMTEFGMTGGVTGYVNTLIFAISVTNDPTGGWYIYKFIDNSFFVDYPHYAAWPDAFYGTSNDFNTAGNTYLGSSIYAFDKAKMIAGNPTATMQRFRLTSAAYATKIRSVAPVNISGNTPPPAGSPGLFLYYHDDNRTAVTTDADSVGFISLKPDFNTPANSFYAYEQSLPVAAFKADICQSRDCVPSAGIGYDAISDRFMNKIYYRNFGTHESIVGTHTVDANYPALPIKAALRWYEFRRSGALWSAYQQSTYSPDADGRFMASININSKGQIALLFNSSGEGKYASIHFTGRNNSDPLNVMAYDERVIKKGDAYGTFGNRWGDYNDLVTDPLNDSIFWSTAMYGSNNWKTQMTAFRLEPLATNDSRLVNITSPAPGSGQCINNIIPAISLRNSGNAQLTTLNIHAQLNNGPVITTSWNGSLMLTQEAQVTLTGMTAVTGINTLKIFTSAPNGLNDEDKTNDTAIINFEILVPESGPMTEGFETTVFPPAKWRLLNEVPGSISWSRTTSARKSGIASAVIRLFDYPNLNHVDNLLTSVTDVSGADSVILSFERAYKIYNSGAEYADSLDVVVSTDCGVTFTSIWKQGGVTLATVTGNQTASGYVPQPADWKSERINLKPFIGNASSVTVGFRVVNRYGQNIYLDDVNVTAYKVPNRDALVKAVTAPAQRLCEKNIIPSITIGSMGRDTLKSVKIMYRLGNGSLDSVQFTGTLLNGATENIQLKNFTLPASGNYTLLVYTKEPNGLNDEVRFNDTMRYSFIVFDVLPAPVTQGFEENVFPPSTWALATSNTGYSWERTLRSASEKVAAAVIRNYRFNSNGKRDELYSPIVTYPDVDSVYIRFDVAHVTSKFPGSTAIPMDTLEVLITPDCGVSYISVYKKWGAALQTVGDPNFPYTYPANDTIGFVPIAKTQFRAELIDVTQRLAGRNSFQVVFRNTSNKGNNTFIDNINISTVTLPARLKENGYMISPNPFDGAFRVQHLLPPANLTNIQVTNATGQVVYEKKFRGNATNNERIDLHRYANGVYQVKLLYDNKVITERIIKKK